MKPASGSGLGLAIAVRELADSYGGRTFTDWVGAGGTARDPDAAFRFCELVIDWRVRTASSP